MTFLWYTLIVTTPNTLILLLLQQEFPSPAHIFTQQPAYWNVVDKNLEHKSNELFYEGIYGESMYIKDLNHKTWQKIIKKLEHFLPNERLQYFLNLVQEKKSIYGGY